MRRFVRELLGLTGDVLLLIAVAYPLSWLLTTFVRFLEETLVERGL